MGLKEKCNPITLEHISMDIEKEKAQAERISSLYAQIKSWKPFPCKRGCQEELCARNLNPRKRKRLKMRNTQMKIKNK